MFHKVLKRIIQTQRKHKFVFLSLIFHIKNKWEKSFLDY